MVHGIAISLISWSTDQRATLFSTDNGHYAQFRLLHITTSALLYNEAFYSLYLLFTYNFITHISTTEIPWEGIIFVNIKRSPLSYKQLYKTASFLNFEL